MILSEDIEKFKKLKISNITELALIAPANYLDYREKEEYFSKNLLIGIDIKKRKISKKFLKIFGIAKNGMLVEVIFFRYTSYHLKTFREGDFCYLYGRAEKSFSKITLLQPKKISISSIGKIIPDYNTPLRKDIFRKIIQKYLKIENLIDEGIEENIAKKLFTIHFPDEKFLKEYEKNNCFSKKYLEALKYAEIYNYLKEMKKKKKRFKALKKCLTDIEPFIKSLPFRLTVDQIKTIYEIKNDLAKDIAAKRVIIGDVGSGKSIVMFAVAFMAYPNRAILMAPTSILATQLYQEARKFLPEYVKIALFTSSKKDESLKKFHFIIGTHALLYEKLPSACVVMVDEQHRFGTNQREALKKLLSKEAFHPHYFQFSATPIPRTQALIESQIVDISLIKTTPFKREVATKIVTKKDFNEIILHIKSELRNNRQILIVYPHIEENSKVQYKSLFEGVEFWKKYFDGIYVTYGKDANKSQVLMEFRDKGKILLSTTVVEVGISLPRLSTIIVVGAENLGLATLHQLRGRVSRTAIKGYCFLFTNKKDSKRLAEFSKIQDGFEVAELDLKYRQSGDLLKGTQQSGKNFKFINLYEDKEIILKATKNILRLSV